MENVLTEKELNAINTCLVNAGYVGELYKEIPILKISENNFQISIPVTTKKFIQQVLITEMADVVKISPWLGFISMGSAIEFLGKCIDSENPTDWDAHNRSRKDFEYAIENINAFSKYRHLLRPIEATKQEKNDKIFFDLYDELRCGLTHSFAPKGRVSLSHGDKEEKNLIVHGNIINFNADEMYNDLRLACEEVIAKDFPEPNKMNQVKIFINLNISTPN